MKWTRPPKNVAFEINGVQYIVCFWEIGGWGNFRDGIFFTDEKSRPKHYEQKLEAWKSFWKFWPGISIPQVSPS